MDSKVCRICGCSKPISEFPKKGKNGALRTECKPCIKVIQHNKYIRNKEKYSAKSKEYYLKTRDAKLAYQREYRANNIDKVKESQKKYLQSNRELLCERKKNYYEKNKARLLQYAKKRYAENTEEIKYSMRRSYGKHKEKYLYRSANRRVLQRQRSVPWARQEEIKRIYLLAKRITDLTGVPHVVDHCLPLHGRIVSGLHVEGNLKVVSAHYNSGKHNNVPQYLSV